MYKTESNSKGENMSYDNSKDKLITTIAEFEDDKGGHIHITINAYDGGEEKIGITRYYLDKESKIKHARLGRTSYEESIRLSTALIAAVKWMEDHTSK